MNSQLFPSSLLHSTISSFFFIFISITTSHCYDAELFTNCSRPYNCGAIQNISYPFWGDARPAYCGNPGFKLNCVDGGDQNYSTISIDSQEFRVLEVNQSGYTMRLARMDFWNSTCPVEYRNTSLNFTLFDYATTDKNISLFYGCAILAGGNNFTCLRNGGESSGAFFMEEPELEWTSIPNAETCETRVNVPVLETALEAHGYGHEGAAGRLQTILKQGFDVVYEVNMTLCDACVSSGGLCGTSNSTQSFNCLCRDQPHSSVCRGGNRNWKLKIGIGFGAGGFGIIITCVIFIIYLRRKKKHYAQSFLSRNISSDPSSRTDLENMGKYFGVNIFTYNELEEATNNFDSSKELGDGGFGTVYHGKLRDGRVVAVKRLYENNYKRVEQFMNEVEILTRLRHQNLVALYGSTSRHSRELLLVYEYVPNGTVADHLHGEREKPGSPLPWCTRINIAIETASALKYLHASDIIHRDVKTNNILLDNNFTVKVADFGLSRLFPTDVTHVSTAPQGTPGYVDPEYHQCYQLTDKSDVYSFGVVLIELISSKPAVDITRHRHEINLSNMAINKIQNHALHELVDPNLGFQSDYKVWKMITGVAELAFRCLQNEKEMRPSMEEVLEVLKAIQCESFIVENAEEVDILADSVVLLKNGPVLSPKSVIAKWSSTTTTPNASG